MTTPSHAPPAPVHASAPGDTGVPPSHEEVLQATETRAREMQGLVRVLVSTLPLAALPRPAAAKLFAAGAAGAAGAGAGAAAVAALARAAPTLGVALLGGLVGGAVVLAAMRWT